MSNTLNKDFYSYIPLWIQNKLDMKLVIYKDEEWFEPAWNTYRKICLTVAFRDIPDPDVFFAKAEADFPNPPAISLTASEDLTDDVSFEERTDDILESTEEVGNEETANVDKSTVCPAVQKARFKKHKQ